MASSGGISAFRAVAKEEMDVYVSFFSVLLMFLI